MYGQIKLMDGIRSLFPTREQWISKPSEKLPEKVTVRFKTGQTGLLDMKNPRSVHWVNIIDRLEKAKKPVYVEIDEETNFITKLLIPIVDKVKVLEADERGDVVVGLVHSPTVHILLRSDPNFETIYNALQSALDDRVELLITETRDEHEIIDARPPMEPPGGRSGPVPNPPPDDPVSEERAEELFNNMNAESCDPCNPSSECIPFKYPDSGCQARAHKMCYTMVNDHGEEPEKVWIFPPPPYATFSVPTLNHPDCSVSWMWHVAPTLVVSTSGGDEKRVIDPSLSNIPLTINDWRDLQDPNAIIEEKPWTEYFFGEFEPEYDPDLERTNRNLDDRRDMLRDRCIEFGPPPYSCMRHCFFISDRNTFSESEIAAMLQASNPDPAEIEAAFYVVVDGFSPEDDFGITSATLTGEPNIRPTLEITPGIDQMTVDPPVSLDVVDPLHLRRRQRLTWTYKITFTGTDGFDFAGDVEPVTLSATITTVSSGETVSNSATIYLIKQPNPYEIDGETSWLSTDLRVFQIRQGESKFNVNMDTDANDFITQVITNLNTNNTGGQTFEADISVDQQTSRLELSQEVDSVAVYNFAVAKVRYRSLIETANYVRVFFRLIPWATTSVSYDQDRAYRCHESGGTVVPLLGIEGDRTSSIPCFASPRINSASASMTTQTDTPNVQEEIPADASGKEVVRYFGCWLDFNQTQEQFPITPSPSDDLDGPYSSGRISIYDHVRGEHQCLVAEIAFDLAPIQSGASPASSDKLAQRNLAIYETPNPGLAFSRRIPHTFEIRPSASKIEHDEIMIDWGNIPVGSVATLYLPGIDTNDIMLLASQNYRTHRLVRIDENTLKFETCGITYLPIPPTDGNFPGLLTVDLPEGIEKGQAFKVVVRQMTHRMEASRPSWRHIVGSFQLTIPVREKAEILPRQQRLLSNLRWIERAIPANDRWLPVFSKYVTQIADRVDALGGDSKKVAASPSGEWRKAYRNCFILTSATALLIAALVVGIGMLTGGLMAIMGTPVFALLIGAVYFWKKKCRPRLCQLLGALLVGAGVGAVILAVFALFAGATPQLVATLIAVAGVTAITAILSWKMGCFRK